MVPGQGGGPAEQQLPRLLSRRILGYIATLCQGLQIIRLISYRLFVVARARAVISFISYLRPHFDHKTINTFVIPKISIKNFQIYDTLSRNILFAQNLCQCTKTTVHATSGYGSDIAHFYNRSLCHLLFRQFFGYSPSISRFQIIQHTICNRENT